MTKKAQPKNKAQVQKAQPKAQAPKGRNNSAQGNALGKAAPEEQSPEGAKQPEQTQGYDELGNALPPSAISDSELPTGWQWVRVHEVGAVQLGRQRAPKHENGANMRPYLRVANVFEDRFDLSDVKTMNFTPSEFETFELKQNDILLNEGQSLHLVGRPALYRGEVPGACFQNTLVRFRPGPKVDPKFALTIFRGYMHTGKFQKIARWTTNIAHLGASRFAEMPFPLPPLPDQRRIVAEIEKQFTRLEAGVAALRRVQANLNRYRAAVLKAACEGRLVPTEAELSRSGVPPLNPTSTAKPASSKAGSKVSTNPKRQDAASTFESGQQLLARILTERRRNWQGRGKYKEPASLSASGYEPDSLPEGWGRSSIAQVAFLDVGFAFKSAEFEKSGIRLLRGENLEPGRMRWADTRYWPESKLPEVEHLLIRVGEIVLAMDRPLISSGLKIARAREHDLPCLLVQRMARLRPVVESMTPFLFMVMNTQGFIKHLLGGQTGTQLPHISGEGIQSFDFPLPPLAEQTRIVAEVERRLSVVEELEAVVTTNLQRAIRLRQSVLQKAFTGEL